MRLSGHSPTVRRLGLVPHGSASQWWEYRCVRSRCPRFTVVFRQDGVVAVWRPSRQEMPNLEDLSPRISTWRGLRRRRIGVCATRGRRSSSAVNAGTAWARTVPGILACPRMLMSVWLSSALGPVMANSVACFTAKLMRWKMSRVLPLRSSTWRPT
jgi:hypothetical protein